MSKKGGDLTFREALQLYEQKQYKKSNKLLETVLKKNATNADSLALKAVNLYHIGDKDQATSYIKKALAAKVKSPIACHILGIYYRTVKDYAKAAEFFKQAVDNGSQNSGIWRDLASLESQNRQYKDVLTSRHKFLELNMGYRSNWTGLAVAYHLNHQYDKATTTLKSFEDLAKGKLGEAEMYEHGECHMYRNELLNEGGHVQEALDNLAEIEAETLDKTAWLEYKAKYLMKLGRKKDASKVYRKLLKRNPDNFKYYTLLEAALEVDAEQRLKMYDALAKFYPRSEPPMYVPLTFVQGTEFVERIEKYLSSQLKRGVPATFNNVKPLYQSKFKREVIRATVDKLVNTEDPVQLVWCLYFLAQHCLYTGELTEALEHINRAIEHTPTLVELYLVKARIQKHCGQLQEAAESMDESRKLDLQDRFINGKAVKYYLRSNNIEKAVEIASLFTKNDDAVNGVKDLHLMEANWFIVEQAEAYHRLYKAGDARARGLALKRYRALHKIHTTYYDDQFDFHSYCMRKGTPRAYIDMLKWADKLYLSPMYIRAVRGAAELYFELCDTPFEKSKEKVNKKKREEEAKVIAAYPNDNDPFGENLLAVKKPLEALGELVKPMWDQVSNKAPVSSSIVEFKYQLRTEKLALCVAALNKLPVSSPWVSFMVLALRKKLEDENTDKIARAVAQKALEKYSEITWESNDEPSFARCEALLEIYHLTNDDAIKEALLVRLAKFDPAKQSKIMSAL